MFRRTTEYTRVIYLISTCFFWFLPYFTSVNSAETTYTIISFICYSFYPSNILIDHNYSHTCLKDHLYVKTTCL